MLLLLLSNKCYGSNLGQPVGTLQLIELQVPSFLLLGS